MKQLIGDTDARNEGLFFMAHYIDEETKEIYFDILEDGRKVGRAYMSRQNWLSILAALNGSKMKWGAEFHQRIEGKEEFNVTEQDSGTGGQPSE